MADEAVLEEEKIEVSKNPFDDAGTGRIVLDKEDVPRETLNEDSKKKDVVIEEKDKKIEEEKRTNTKPDQPESNFVFESI